MSAGVRAVLHVKICGVRSVENAVVCADAGADAIGVNFYPGSPRVCDERVAREIVREVGSRVRVVAVFANAGVAEVQRVRVATGVEWVQLHGDEPPEDVAALGEQAYKALRARSWDVIEEAARYGGRPLLIDAWVATPGVLGGSGVRARWEIAERLARGREVLLAGGLTAGDVAEAVAAVRPWGVDVASGVERAVGEQDPEKIRAFVAAARGARNLET